MLINTVKKSNFVTKIAIICLIYMAIEIGYIYFAKMGPDDFWFAHWIYRYKNNIPYRDFAPYKTVLGYYLLLVPMLSSKDFLTPLIHTRIILAYTNACLFLVAAFWLQKFFLRDISSIFDNLS